MDKALEHESGGIFAKSIIFHWDTGSQIHQICLRLKTFGRRIMVTAAVYFSLEPQPLTAFERRLQKSWRSISFTTVQNLIGSKPDRLKQRRHCYTNIEHTHWLEVTQSSHYCAIFWCCNTTQFVLQHSVCCNFCWEQYKVRLFMTLTTYKFSLLKSFTMMLVTLY